ncbi:MAG: DUF1499 domain-containing protein [Acidiferrobacterales bacterium]
MQNKTSKKSLYKPAVIGFGLILISLIVAMTGPLGSRIGWWDFTFAVTLVTWSVYLGLFAALLCSLGLIVARPGSRRRGFVFSLLGLIIIVPMILFLQSWNEAKMTLPPIQDITTNTDTPPEFWISPNSRMYGGKKIAVLQKKFYPDIQPLFLSVPADKVFDLSIKVIQDKGWQLWEPSRVDMHIEATHKTFWFGFSDDVIIHITAVDKTSSRIDMRSTSRFGGGGDGGTNANRIRSFFKALAKRAQQ